MPYYLWSVERVAMLYNLETINGKDWYRWGVEALLPNQSRSGAWTERATTHTNWNGGRPISYGAILNTSFALLFLKRSHPMRDLTPKLPDKWKELNQGIAQLQPKDKFPFHTTTAPIESKRRDRPSRTPIRGAKHQR